MQYQKKIHRGFNTLYTPIFESFFPYIAQEFSNNEKKSTFLR